MKTNNESKNINIKIKRKSPDSSSSGSSSSKSPAKKIVKRLVRKKGKTDKSIIETDISKKYQKMDHKEHILKKPDSYLGSVNIEKTTQYVLSEDDNQCVNIQNDGQNGDQNGDQNDGEEDVSSIGSVESVGSADGSADGSVGSSAGGNINSEFLIQKKDFDYCPGFYKCFDELLVNAFDHTKRQKKKIKEGDKKALKVNTIKVEIDAENGFVSVLNDGDGIDIEMHPEYKMYPPTLIFGKLLTSTNYDDNDEREWGGRNGYGAKLANIFSKQMDIETVDHLRKKKFKQTFTENMDKMSKPKITSCSGKPYTKVTWYPDFARFNMTHLDKDHVSLFKKRVYDVAACSDPDVSVFLNKKKIPQKNFEKYVNLYIGSNSKRPRAIESKDGWNVIATFNDDEEFEQVSFVNGVNTIRGGTHVDYIVDQIKKKLAALIKKKKKVTVKLPYIKNQLMVFVNSTVVNPEFDGQTKETLKTTKTKFKHYIELSDKFINRLYNTKILELILEHNNYKNQKALKKIGGKMKTRISGIPKLDDANWAGTKRANQCTLILTEGDSAKTLAISGLSVVGRDQYGIYPLKGKPLNVRDESKKIKNKEIIDIMQILGLEPGKKYTEESLDKKYTLRYGRVMIMADQDLDGTHIKGLILNLFDELWPELLKRGMICSLLTPIVKATKKKQVKCFYNEHDFEKWAKKWQGKPPGWNIKYYKGLGTSMASEAKEYFKTMKVVTYYGNNITKEIIMDMLKEPESNPDSDLIKLGLDGDTINDVINALEEVEEEEVEKEIPEYNVDGTVNLEYLKNKILAKYGTRSETLLKIKNGTLSYKTILRQFSKIDLAFNKDRADDRKKWMANYDPSTIVNYDQKNMSCDQFIDVVMILFSIASVRRAIPNIADGFKPSIRKIIFSAFKKNIKREIKVAQFVGYVSEHSNYHHGEKSLEGAVVGLAQKYVGSNNINLLMPQGQFGTRLQGGSDAASSRYIFTNISKTTKLLFNNHDNELLNYLFEEGDWIEPEYYYPLLPLHLVNGTKGIATGWSTEIPSHNPLDLAKIIRQKILDQPIMKIKPWYRGFDGTIEPYYNRYGVQIGYLTRGKYEKVNDTQMRITELPIGHWTNKFKEMLDKMIIDKSVKPAKKNKKGARNSVPKQWIRWFDDQTTETKVDITLTFVEDTLDEILDTEPRNGITEFERIFKLTSTLPTTNMWLFDYQNKIKKYSSVQSIIDEWYTGRLSMYVKRRDYLLGKIQKDLDVVQYKIKFIFDFINEKIEIRNVDIKTIIAKLKELQFPTFITDSTKSKKNNQEDDEDDEDDNDGGVNEEDENEEGGEEGTVGNYNYLLNMNIRKLTKNEIQKLQKKQENMMAELNLIKETSAKQIWLNELAEFEKHYKADLIAYNKSLIDVKPMKITKKKGRGTKKPRAKKTK